MSAQRVPAWKRLGLKLKGATSDDSPALPTNGTPNQSSRPNAAAIVGSPANGISNKRNLTPSAYSNANSNSNYSSSPYHPANKRLRTGERSFGSDRDTSSLRRQKSVSFASDTKDSSTQAQTTKSSQKPTKSKSKKKKKKQPKAPAEPAPEFDLTPTVSYLRQWATAREAWKFNKNHQTLLIKYVFDGTPKIPSADVNVFLDYIRDIQGGVRNRLRDTAAEIRKTDMEKGVAGFPADMIEREEKQKRYEEVIGRFLEDQKEVQQLRKERRQGDDVNGTAAAAGSKRSFDEVEFVLRTAEPELKQRLIKRIRAELVLEELSDSEDSTASGKTTTSASSTQDGEVADNEMDVDTKPINGTQAKTKRRRVRNLRTANLQASSSSSSSSESESEDDSESSSSSSEDESEDLEMEEANGVESSSSSSSSSDAAEASESGSDDSDDDEEE